MTRLEELARGLLEAEVQYEFVAVPYASVNTPFGIVRLELKSCHSEFISDLVKECQQYAKVWIYSVEELASSGHFMLRYTWVA